MTTTARDHAMMTRALRLAERGLASCQPNPRVGAVLVQDDAIVGEGWHQRAGEAHAEVNALAQAGAQARGATAYVTLEPCAHQGRTGPCTEALIAAAVKRVVVAVEDPDPRTNGQGIARLRAAGIEVETGLLRNEARELNRGFFSRIERARPWLRIKLAMSLDGRTALANGQSKWISGDAARADVQHWRARSSAILTGSGTVLADNPHLTVRPSVPVSPDVPADPATTVPFVPWRVVLDTGLATPASAHVLDGSAPTLLLHAPDARRAAHFAKVECAPIAVTRGRLDLAAALALLAARDCNEVQVEAGATLAGECLASGLADELLLYVAPVLLGDEARPLLSLPPLTEMAARWKLRLVDQRMVGADWRLLLRPQAGG